MASPYDLRLGLGDSVREPEIQSALRSGDLGFVHSFTTGSCVDGPGIRVVIWLTGCHFRCVFCHNPDTWKLNNGIPVPLPRAVQEIRKYRYGLETMKGGATVTGGEPLLQDRFVVKLFRGVKRTNIHTAVETNGYLGDRLSDGDLLTCDLVMLGLKAVDTALHRRITGMDNGPVLAFARRLAALGRPMWIRWVLVPGVNDDPDEIARVAAFAAELRNVERVELLPFHQLGRFKWDRLGMRYPCRDTRPPSSEQIDAATSVLRAAGLQVH